MESKVDWDSHSSLDLGLALFMDKLFFLGCSGDVASKTLAAVKFYYPEVGRYGQLRVLAGAGALWRARRPRGRQGKTSESAAPGFEVVASQRRKAGARRAQ